MQWKPWKDLARPQRVAVTVVATAQLVLAGAAWADLARRPVTEVNGSKARWAVIIAINWVGPLAWFRWGRREERPRPA